MRSWHAQGNRYIEGDASTEANPDTKKFSMYSFGAQFAEVRVDEDLGQIQDRRMVGAFGAGAILNAKTARSQFIGGMRLGHQLRAAERDAYDEGWRAS